ncbi:MAG: imidazole glycerol phosphate synthase subunit HisH [Rickettsiales bacterium]|nr:imidazole glycerol phosphate synthase subunit HisH [Rickettsiales bacterium]
MKLLIIDYGAGNLKSVENAFRKIIVDENLDVELVISDKKEDFISADKIFLPGVGAYGDCMNSLNKRGVVAELKNQVLNNKKKFLGICVGMQVLSSKGYEDGEYEGLDFIAGEVKRIDNNDSQLKVPHMGWNEVKFLENDDILSGINEIEHFYFANSYKFEVANKKDELGYCNYGQDITSVVKKDNIVGLQFHPEKSGEAGLKVLSNFLKW